MLLPAALMQDLSRRRLTVGHARPRGGVGERPSRARGAGLEFAEFRPYAPGDDIRSLDPAASLRAGSPIVREYTVNQQLTVVVALDASRSMALGDPDKFSFARSLAAVFAYVGLSGGDVVQLACTGATGDQRLSARLGGQGRTTEALGWLAAQALPPRGGADDPAGRFSRSLRSLAPRVPRGALCVVVSDFLDEDTPTALRPLYARGELIAVQVLSPQERDPALYRRKEGGPLHLLDAEDREAAGAVVELDRRTLEGYQGALNAWNEELRQQVTRQGGRLLPLTSSTPLEDVVRRDLLGQGVLA